MIKVWVTLLKGGGGGGLVTDTQRRLIILLMLPGSEISVTKFRLQDGNKLESLNFFCNVVTLSVK